MVSIDSIIEAGGLASRASGEGSVNSPNILSEVSDVNQLFADDVLHVLVREDKLTPYLTSLLALNQAYGRNFTAKRRFLCFVHAVTFLLKSIDSASLLEQLISHAQYLRDEEVKLIIDRIMQEWTCRILSEDTLNHEKGFRQALSLLEVLSSRLSGADKLSFMKKYSSMSIPPRILYPYFASFASFVEVEDDGLLWLAKLESYSHLHLNKDSSTIAMSLFERDDHQQESVVDRMLDNPSEIPSLINDLVSIPSRITNPSLQMKARVMLMVHNILESLFRTLLTNRSFDSNILRSALQPVALHLTNDHGSGAAMLELIHSSTSNSLIDDAAKISPSKLLLCFLAMKSPRSESKILAAVVQAMKSSMSTTSQHAYLWLKCSSTHDLNPSNGRRVVPMELWKEAIQGLLSKESVVEEINQQLHALAFYLIKHEDAAVSKQYKMLALTLHPSTSLPSPLTNSSQQAAPPGLRQLGHWLLTILSDRCEASRFAIIRDTIFLLNTTNDHQVSSAEVSMTAPRSVEASCVSILHNLCRKQLTAVMDVESELLELLMIVRDKSPDIAKAIMIALSPLLQQSSGFADRVTMVLRKLSFGSDISSRKSAISAICGVADISVLGEQNPADSHHHRWSPLSIDEMLSMLRRSLSHQVEVRSYLYQELMILSQHNRLISPVLIQFLLHHLQGLNLLQQPTLSSGDARHHLSAYASLGYGTNHTMPNDAILELLLSLMCSIDYLRNAALVSKLRQQLSLTGVASQSSLPSSSQRSISMREALEEEDISSSQALINEVESEFKRVYQALSVMDVAASIGSDTASTTDEAADTQSSLKTKHLFEISYASLLLLSSSSCDAADSRLQQQQQLIAVVMQFERCCEAMLALSPKANKKSRDANARKEVASSSSSKGNVSALSIVPWDNRLRKDLAFVELKRLLSFLEILHYEEDTAAEAGADDDVENADEIRREINPLLEMLSDPGKSNGQASAFIHSRLLKLLDSLMNEVVVEERVGGLYQLIERLLRILLLEKHRLDSYEKTMVARSMTTADKESLKRIRNQSISSAHFVQLLTSLSCSDSNLLCRCILACFKILNQQQQLRSHQDEEALAQHQRGFVDLLRPWLSPNTACDEDTPSNRQLGKMVMVLFELIISSANSAKAQADCNVLVCVMAELVFALAASDPLREKIVKTALEKSERLRQVSPVLSTSLLMLLLLSTPSTPSFR
jgi:hypothetical protein